MPFHGLKDHFFLVLSNIPLSIYYEAQSIYPFTLKDVWVASKF